MNSSSFASPIHLDDRIYCLQRTPELPAPLRLLLHNADVAYIQGDDDQALEIVSRIESACSNSGISIFRPDPIGFMRSLNTAPTHKLHLSDDLRRHAIQQYEKHQHYRA